MWNSWSSNLGLPYRIVQLCGGDLSFTSALTYDFEVYAAAQKKWLEVSSVSNFESYQANRLKLAIPGTRWRKRPTWHIPSMEVPWPFPGSWQPSWKTIRHLRGSMIPRSAASVYGKGK